MVTLLEAIAIFLFFSLIGFLLGYIVAFIICKKSNKYKIIQRGKICEERAKISQEHLDLLEKESQQIVDIAKRK